jgi:hypothetical protein
MKKTLLILTCFILAPSVTHGAILELGAPPQGVRVGDTFLIPVSLNTENEIINAFEISVRLPESLTLSEVRYSNSAVSFWLEEPKERTLGTISFSGVFPGGYQSISTENENTGNLLTLVVQATKEGGEVASFGTDSKVLANDGNGTQVTLTQKDLVFNILASEGNPSKPAVFVDTNPPEAFTLETVSGEPFGISGDVLVFITVDKDSGLSGYQVARTWLPLPQKFLSWKETVSPTRLTKWDAYRFVYIRATDMKGNAVVTHTTPRLLQKDVLAGIVILLLCIGTLFFLRNYGILKRK